jgi:hypothetical protein
LLISTIDSWSSEDWIWQNSCFPCSGTPFGRSAITPYSKLTLFPSPPLQIIELLYRSHWTAIDGLGALIISPTRELALQIFETLQLIGRHHSFSAGLIIGGKDLRSEQARKKQREQ